MVWHLAIGRGYQNAHVSLERLEAIHARIDFIEDIVEKLTIFGCPIHHATDVHPHLALLDRRDSFGAGRIPKLAVHPLRVLAFEADRLQTKLLLWATFDQSTQGLSGKKPGFRQPVLHLDRMLPE